MTYKVVIDNDKEFTLLRWNYVDFEVDWLLRVQTDDLPAVKNAFSSYNQLDFYRDDELIGSLTKFDSYQNISYVGLDYNANGDIVECLGVTLSEADLGEKIKRIEEQINPTIDVTKASLSEYKEWQLQQVSKACTDDIYNGDDVTLSNGAVETFSFTEKDQTDLQALANLAMGNPSLSLAWHSNGQPCKMYSGIDIIIIYQTLYMKLLYDTTVCNAINVLIRNAQTKEEVENYYWGCELPEESQENVDAILDNMTAIVNGIKAQYVPQQDATSNEEE